MFDPQYWAMVEPTMFPYGDGVYGISRETEISFDEWVAYLLNREELLYDSVLMQDQALFLNRMRRKQVPRQNG